VRSLSATELSALTQRAVALRNLVWITVKNRDTGAKVSFGFWDDVGTVAHQIIDGITGGLSVQVFTGAGSLLQIEDIASAADLSIKTVRIRLSGINSQVANAVRGYDPRLAPIQIYRVILNPATGNAYAPARARFVGVVDELTIVDPRSGEQGKIEAIAVSQFRESARANPDMTSNESQKLRGTRHIPSVGEDKFYKYANDVTTWEIMWGANSLKVDKKDKDDKKDDDKKKKDKDKKKK
jgi:hypothetical protein